MAASSPSVFDIAISVAGYGMGTYMHNRSPFCGAPPQPMSSEVLDRFVETYATKIAKVGRVFVIHARHDQVSHFADAERIAKAVRDADGHVEMLVVEITREGGAMATLTSTTHCLTMSLRNSCT